MDRKLIASVRTTANCGMFTQHLELRDETVHLVQRKGMQSLTIDLPVEHLARERAVVRHVGLLGALIAVLAIVPALLVATFGGPDALTAAIAGTLAALSLAGVAYAVWDTKSIVLTRNQLADLVVLCRQTQVESVLQFLESAHEAKLRLIGRRILNITTLSQLEDMHKRLSMYLDARILSLAEFETLTKQVDDRRMRVS